VKTEVLNAKDFGLPQNRERIFIVGFKDRSIEFSFPKGSKEKTRLGDILFNRVPDKYTISNKLWASHQMRKKEHERKGYGFGFSKFTRNSPYTSTISARYYKDGSEILIEQKNKESPRKLTPREAARLQGFDDTFEIPVSDTQAYKQFGNAVPVNVIRAIAERMVKVF
jgi:DNA (cytosine-5)-methyltransferase 1